MDTLSVQGEQRPGMTSEPTHNANSRNTPKQGWTKYGQVATGGAPLEGHGRVKLQAVVNKQGQIELDLSSQNLRKIPPDVFNQLRTESLKLHSNDLQLIPSAISRLHKLRVLDLHENAISTLPETLTNLLHLQELDLSNNKLGSVPPMLGSFKYLRVLKLSYNQFETLPHELGDLTALRRFEAEGNKLWHLPYSFQHLQHLHHLNLSRNHFDQVPICVCQMKGLETLDMHENKLINLPPDLDHLKSLLELNLASNSFEIIPQCVMNLKTLTSLDWSHNQIQKVTSKISRLTKLRVLNVEDNQLPSLPTHLQAVEYLNVARNKIHNFSVAKMRRLVYLNASHNQLENMPLGVYNLSHIKVLKLRENLISYLSQDVVLLKKLMTLDLSNNRLTSLPHVINELEHLEVLNVKGNRIESRYRYPYTNERGKAEQGIGDHPVPLVPLGYATPNVGRRQIPNGHIVSHPNDQIAQHNLVSAEAQTRNRRVSAPPEAPMSISPAHTVIRSRTRLPKQTEIRAETPIPNGNFHTETMPRHLYLQDPGGTVTKYTQKEHFHHTRKPSRFSKFRQSLGLGKTQKNRTPKLHSTAHTGIVRERPPLNYTTSNPTVDPNTVYNTWKVRHASEIEYGAQTPDYDHEYSAEFRNGAYDDSMLVRNAIAADSKPLSVTEITYPMESAIWEPDYAQCNPTVSKAIPNGSTLGERIGNNHGYKGKSHVYAYVKDHKLEQQVAHQDGHTDIDDLLQQENDDPSTLFNHSRIPYTDDWLREERNFHKSSIRSTAVTVNDSVGDRLSLGDEDFEFQPTTVTDYRLLGVCNDLETMLSQQLLQPIISHKGIFRKRQVSLQSFTMTCDRTVPTKF